MLNSHHRNLQEYCSKTSFSGDLNATFKQESRQTDGTFSGTPGKHSKPVGHVGHGVGPRYLVKISSLSCQVFGVRS